MERKFLNQCLSQNTIIIKKRMLYFFLIIISSGNAQNKNIPVVSSQELYAVKEFKNIEYAKGYSHSSLNSDSKKIVSLKLDAYVPNSSVKNRPAMILIHGGGFTGGDKNHRHIVSMSKKFAAQGWVVFSINYRLKKNLGTVPKEFVSLIDKKNIPRKERAYAIYPANRDAKAAVRWVYANAENYDINTDYITVGGGSAGAIIAVQLGVTNPDDYTSEISLSEDKTLETTHLKESSKVHTILDFWGSATAVKILEGMSNKNRFNIKNASLLIVHGTKDPTVSFEEAKLLKKIYSKTGVTHVFYPVEGAGHGVWEKKINGKSLSELSFDFIVKSQNIKVE